MHILGLFIFLRVCHSRGLFVVIMDVCGVGEISIFQIGRWGEGGGFAGGRFFSECFVLFLPVGRFGLV